jgi:ApaG protein
METMSDNLNGQIRVETQAVYLPHQSDPAANRYVFAYTINISNTGQQPAQLLTRYWLITDADGNKQEVQGDGVVGEQPKIEPGATHTYSSGTVIETPVGTMEGRYGMVDAAGSHFDAAIPVFRLAVPGVLN